MKKPRVSIIVVNYNGKKFLNDCFGSLMNLNYPKSKLEIIMVDNGSTDGSIEFVKEKFSKVKILKNDVNNYCRANNLGIRHSKGEYIAFLNNDTKVDENWLIELVNAISKDDKIGAVSGKTLYPDGKISNVGHYELPNFYWGEKGAGEEKEKYPDKEERPSLCGVAVLYPKRIFQEIGFIDEDFIIYLEDIDMSYRLRKAGYKLVYVPSAIVYHYFHGTGSHELSRFYIERNRLLFLAKHYPHMLMGSLLGSGYFTAQKDINSTGKIYLMLPDVIIKLLKEHPLNYIKEILVNLFEELKKISNYENDLLVKKIQEQLYCLNRNQEEFKSLQEKLAMVNQLVVQKENEIKDKEILISNIQRNLDKLSTEIDSKKQLLIEKDIELRQKDEELRKKDEELRQKNEELRQKNEELRQKDEELRLQEEELKNYTEQISQKTKELEFLRENNNLLIKELETKKKEITLLQDNNIKLSNELNEIRKNYEEKVKELSCVCKELKNIYESEGYRFILWPIWQIIAKIRTLIKGVIKLISLIFLSFIFMFLPILFFFEEKLWQLFSSLLKKKIKNREVVPFEKLKISVVIPHYNRTDLLKECLSSLFSLEEFKNKDNEIILVDDASTNNSIEFIKTNFPQVRIIKNRINRGFGYSANRGIKEAKNELILLLNNDCIVTKDFLEPLIRHFQDEKVFAVTPKFYSWDRTSFSGGMWMGEFKNGHIKFWNEIDTKNGEKIYQTAPTAFAIGACILFRKKDYLWLGGFDKLYRPYCWEDIDLSHRAWKRGFKVLYEPQSIVYHKRNASIGEYKRSLERKNEIVFIWKNITDQLMIFAHFLSLPFKIYRNDLSFTIGFLWALSLLPFALLSRFRERKYKNITDKHVLRQPKLYYRNFEKRKFKVQESPRKTILMLTPFPPYKPKHGSQMIIWNRLKAIYQEYDIILLTFLENEKQFDYLPELKLYCRDAFAFLRVADKVSFIQRLLYPEPVRKRYSNIKFKNKLLEVIGKYPIDLALIETSFMIQYVNYIEDIPTILEEHDASILSLWTSFERRINSNFMHNLFDWIRNRVYLRHYYKKFDKIIAFTEPDAKLLWRINPYLDIFIIPPGIDLELFEKDKEYEKDIDILFVGHFAHYPNVDGMKFFFKNIYPILKQRLQRFTFKIIGSGIKKEEFMRLFKIDPEDKNIEFIEELENEEVIEYLFRTKVFIAPIRIGGGVKTKILEAMAAGVATLSMPAAVRGLGLENRKDIVLVNNRYSFVNALINLIGDIKFRETICINAKNKIVDRFNNEKILIYLDTCFQILNASSYNRNKYYELPRIGEWRRIELANFAAENYNIPKENHVYMRAAWHLIFRCNYACPYCINGPGRDMPENWEHLESFNFHYSLDEWLDFWERIFRKLGEFCINLAGGEPFVYPNFIKLLRELITIHKVEIITNLSFDVKYFLRYFNSKRIRLFPSFHPYCVDLNKFLDKIILLKEAGFCSGVIIVAFPPLIEKLDYFKEIFNSKGIEVWLNPFIGIYRGIRYPEGYNDKEKEYILSFSPTSKFQEYQFKNLSPQNFYSKGRPCYAGMWFFRVDGRGIIARCSSSQSILGSIKKDDFNLLSSPLPCDADFCVCQNEYIYVEDEKEIRKLYFVSNYF